MAAVLHPTPAGTAEIVDLRTVSARDLEPLLQEETAGWRSKLEWEFEPSADLVRRFVELRSLAGSALVVGGRVAGYVYYILEEDKGLIGDLYVIEESRSLENENCLMEAALADIMAFRSIDRIEAQLMMLEYHSARSLPRADCLSAYQRNFMRIDLRHASLDEGRVRRPMYLEEWSDHYHHSAALVLAAAYAGHVDSRINDQYRSAAGARKFLYNIVQYPGCGAFCRPASYVAFDAATGQLCGISLASIVAPECGHLTQICVAPYVRGTGIGHAMMRQSLLSLRRMGCSAVSLTVTTSNEDAVALYERVGFRTARHFAAYVWEGC